MGTTATAAAKLAGTDGGTICICGHTARSGIVAARATTPVTVMHGGIPADKDTSRRRLTPRPNGQVSVRQRRISCGSV